MNNNTNPTPKAGPQNTFQNAPKITDIKPNGGKDNSNIIIVIILILILGISFYFNNKTNDADDVDNADAVDVLTGDEGLDTEDEVMDKDLLNDDKMNISDDKALNTSNTKPVIVDQNQANYNTAMTSASKAINSGKYAEAVTFYNQALAFKKDDTAYMGLFTAYGAQGDWTKAGISIDNAIKTNPSYTDYWVSKLVMLDEKTNTAFADMQKVYQDGLTKVSLDTKVNLVTSFAVIAEKNGVITEAINIWKYAQEIYPQNSATYQTEIDRLTKTIQ